MYQEDRSLSKNKTETDGSAFLSHSCREVFGSYGSPTNANLSNSGLLKETGPGAIKLKQFIAPFNRHTVDYSGLRAFKSMSCSDEARFTGAKPDGLLSKKYSLKKYQDIINEIDNMNSGINKITKD